MEKTLNSKKFWFDFLGIFLLGGLIIGIFEVFTFDLLDDITNVRIYIIVYFLYYAIPYGYFIFSFLVLFKDIKLIKQQCILKTLLGIYYILFVFSFSCLNYHSPLSYFSGYLCNGVINNNWRIDFKKK